MELGLPLPVVDNCGNLFIASICVNGDLNSMKFKMKVNVATGKSLLRRAMRLSKLLSKYKGKFASVLNGFFAELESGNDEDDIRMFTGWTKKELDDFTNEVARDCHYHLDDDCDQILDSVIEIIMDQPEEYICDKVKQTEKGNV